MTPRPCPRSPIGAVVAAVAGAALLAGCGGLAPAESASTPAPQAIATAGPSGALPPYRLDLTGPLIGRIAQPAALDGDVRALQAVGDVYPDAFGAVVVNEPEGRVEMLLVPGPAGDRLLADATRLSARLRTPVAFFAVPFSGEHMRQTSYDLLVPADWAGPHVKDVVSADFSPLDYRITLYVKAAALTLARQHAARMPEPVTVVLAESAEFQ